MFKPSFTFVVIMFTTTLWHSASVEAVEEECTDVQGNVVLHGMLFVPGPSVCSLCTCWNSEALWCKAIYCDPPFFCKDFKLGPRCCEWECLDKPGENELYELRIKKRAEILAGTAGSISITINSSLVMMIMTIIGVNFYNLLS